MLTTFDSVAAAVVSPVVVVGNVTVSSIKLWNSRNRLQSCKFGSAWARDNMIPQCWGRVPFYMFTYFFSSRVPA